MLRIGPTAVGTALAAAAAAVRMVGIVPSDRVTSLRVSIRTSGRAAGLPVVVAWTRGHLRLRVVDGLARARPHLGMRLPGLLDGRKTGVGLRVLKLLPLRHFFVLALLLALLLSLELVGRLVLGKAV